MVLKTQGNKMADAQEQALDFFKKLLDMAGDGTKVFEMVGKSAEKFEKELKKLNKEVARGTKSYKDQVDKIKELEAAIEDLDESTSKLTKEQIEAEKAAKKKLLTDLQAAAGVQGFNEAVRKTTADLGKQALQGIGSFVKNLQADASGTELASGILSTYVDLASTGVKGFGGVLQAGSLAMATKFPKTAGAASLLGVALETTADGFSKLAKFGIEVLQREAEKTFKAFNTLSASGAMFTDGMTGMRDAARGSQLTVEQFSNVVKNSSENMAQSGMGVTEGARQVGRVGTILKQSGVTNQLLKLGVGFEEQAELTAETVANMRRAAGGMVSDKVVAEQTQKYAENLKLIASITGEDAKKKMEQMRQANAELAFQQKLAGMSDKQRAQINAAMLTMTEQEAKNFRDRVVFGKVINQEGAIFEASLSGQREKGEEQLRLVQANLLTAESNSELNAKYGEQIKQSALNLTGQARAAYAGIDIVKGPAKGYADSIIQANTYTAEAVRQGKINLKGQKGATDGLTDGVIGAEQAAQDLKLALQDELLPAVVDFALVSKEVLQGVRNMLDELGIGGTKATKEKRKAGGIGSMLGGIAGGIGGGAIGAGIGQVLIPIPVLGAAIGAGIGSYLGASGGSTVGRAASEAEFDIRNQKPGAADGGILSGPKSGYSATLHGTEAVVPLPDNRSIPVSMDTGALTAAVHQQSGILTEILRTMRDTNSLTSGILQHSM
jgi:archaellum component FlaC